MNHIPEKYRTIAIIIKLFDLMKQFGKMIQQHIVYKMHNYPPVLLTTKNNLKASLEETKILKECCTVARIVFDAKLILEQDLYDLVGLISTGLSRDLSNYRCKTKSKFNKHVICSYVAVFKSFRIDSKSWNFPVSWLNFIYY